MAETIPQKKLAKLLGLTTRRVRELTDDGVLPKAPDGGYEDEASVARYLAYRERVVADRLAPKDIEEARARYEAARAELMELELAQKRGDLVTLEFMAAELDGILQAVRAGLLSFPAAWADRLGACTSTVERQLMLEDAIAELMPVLERAAVEASAAA